MSFIGLASLSFFKPDIWACVLGLGAYSFKPNQIQTNLILKLKIYKIYLELI